MNRKGCYKTVGDSVTNDTQHRSVLYAKGHSK